MGDTTPRCGTSVPILWTRKVNSMNREQLIDIVNKFHDSNPAAKIFSVGIVDDNQDCVRLYWYTDNDGGHEDFYI